MATIRKRGLKWQAQIRRQGHPAFSKAFLTRDDAVRWSRSQERLIDLGEMISPGQTNQDLKTLSDLIDRYQQEVSVLKRSKSDEFHFRQMKRHPMAKLNIKNLTATSISEYRDHRLKTVSGSTVRKELTLLGNVLKVARNEWRVSTNGDPVGTVRKPSSARGRERRVSSDEMTSLDKAFHKTRNPMVKQVFLFALASGMRRGEVLSLVWSNVDMKQRTAHLPLTKNGESRTVPLSSMAISVLVGLAGARELPPKGAGEKTLYDQQPVFPISANAVRLSWERLKKRATLEDLRFHDLRHEAISRFFEVGLSVPEVALISGHKDVRMLFKYTHLKPENVAKKLAELTGG